MFTAMISHLGLAQQKSFYRDPMVISKSEIGYWEGQYASCWSSRLERAESRNGGACGLLNVGHQKCTYGLRNALNKVSLYHLQ